MKLTRKQLFEIFKFVEENPDSKEFIIGKPIPYMNFGYRQYVRTSGMPKNQKKDISDSDTF